MSQTVLFDHLSPEQQAFVTHRGNAYLFACPGSGKTLTISHKFLEYTKDWSLKNQGVAVLSFTNVAKEEVIKTTRQIETLRNPIAYPHFFGTLDSFIDRFILLRFGYFSSIFGGHPHHPIIIQNNEDFPPFLIKKAECYRSCQGAEPSSFYWEEDGLYKKGNFGKKGQKVGSSCAYQGKYCLDYKWSLLKKGIVSQEETHYFSKVILQEWPDIARIIASRFPIILVDEAQDCSKSQIDLLEAILRNGLKELVLVGDDDQTLYEWRDVIPGYFRKFAKQNDFKEFELTENRRSSQLICNATQLFSERLQNRMPSKANGISSGISIKPVLFLCETDDNRIIEDQFLSHIRDIGINESSDKIGILTRERIESSVHLDSIWSGDAIKRMGKAQNFLQLGKAKDAFLFGERAYFDLFIADPKGLSQQEMRTIIETKMLASEWTRRVFNFIMRIPSSELTVREWEEQFTGLATLEKIRPGFDVTVLRAKKQVAGIQKLASQKICDLQEKKGLSNIVYSTVHGVKGQTFKAILLKIRTFKDRGALSTVSINNLPLNDELIRIAYVAMTRASEVLAVAMPTKGIQLSRFPETLWDYQVIKPT